MRSPDGDGVSRPADDANASPRGSCASALASRTQSAAAGGAAATDLGGAAALQAFLLEMELLDQQRQVAVDALHSSAPPSASKRGAAEDPRPPKKKARASWLRRKLELQELRDEVHVLEANVDFLQLRRASEDLLQDVAQSDSSRAERSDEQQDTWKANAAREKQRREAAQEENARLKARLSAQVQATTAIRATLASARTSSKGGCHVSSTETPRKPMPLYRGLRGVGIFDVLEGGVNSRFDELDAILDDIQRPLSTTETFDVDIRRDGEHPLAATVEFSTARILPFDVSDVASAMKTIMKLGWSCANSGDRVVRRAKDVLATETHFTMPLQDGSSADWSIYCVLRWFHVPGGFLVLVESLTEWSSGGWTHTTRDTGWVAAHRHPKTAKDSKTPPVSQMKLVVRMRPHYAVLDAPGPKSRRLQPMGDVVVPCISKIISSRHQFTDNLLMDAALATDRRQR